MQCIVKRDVALSPTKSSDYMAQFKDNQKSLNEEIAVYFNKVQ